MVCLASAPLRPRLYPSGGGWAGFPSAQVMQWLAHWRAPAWAKRRLGHGHSAAECPLAGVAGLRTPQASQDTRSVGTHAGGCPVDTTPQGGGVSGWRRPLGLAGGSDSLPPFQRRGGYADCACPRAGWAQCAHPLAQPGPNPSAAVVPQGLARLSANWAFANQSCTIAHISRTPSRT